MAGVAGGPGAGIEQQCRKDFYVSPFMDMDMNYTFRVAVPDQRVMVAIRAADNDGLLLAAALTGERITLTDAALLLMLKGLKLRPRPVPPAAPITVVNSEGWPP